MRRDEAKLQGILQHINNELQQQQELIGCVNSLASVKQCAQK